jgi:hypothetical protein
MLRVTLRRRCPHAATAAVVAAAEGFVRGDSAIDVRQLAGVLHQQPKLLPMQGAKRSQIANVPGGDVAFVSQRFAPSKRMMSHERYERRCRKRFIGG